MPSPPPPVPPVNQLRYSAVNADVAPLMIGMPIANVGTTLVRATASSLALSYVAGVVVGGVSPTTIHGAWPTLGTWVLPVGVMTAEIFEWSAVTGEPEGLTPGYPYYLGVVPGTMTLVPPTAPGSCVVFVGFARTPTIFQIRPDTPIFL